MRKRLSAVLVLLAAGCQSPAPVTTVPPAPRPKPVASSPRVDRASMRRTQVPAAKTPPAARKRPATPTVAFLQALAKTVQTQRIIDRHAAEKFREVPAYDPQMMGQTAQEEQPPATEVSPLAADIFERGAYEQEMYTKRLVDELTRQPTPPACKQLLQRYQTLMQLQGIRNKQLASDVQHATQNPGSITPDTRKATLQQAQLYQTERIRIVREINQKIERLRTSKPVIAAQVPLFRVQL